MILDASDDFADVAKLGCTFFEDLQTYLADYFPGQIDRELFPETCAEDTDSVWEERRAESFAFDDTQSTQNLCHDIAPQGTVAELFGPFQPNNPLKYTLIQSIAPLPEFCDPDSSLNGIVYQKCSIAVEMVDGSSRTVVFEAVKDADPLADNSRPQQKIIDAYNAFVFDAASTVPFNTAEVFDQTQAFLNALQSQDEDRYMLAGLALSFAGLAYGAGMRADSLLSIYDAEINEIGRLHISLQKAAREFNDSQSRYKSLEGKTDAASQVQRGEAISEMNNARRSYTAAADALTERLQIRLKNTNIRVSTSNPGAIPTLPEIPISRTTAGRYLEGAGKLTGYAMLAYSVYEIAGKPLYDHYWPSEEMVLRADITKLFGADTNAEEFARRLEMNPDLKKDMQVLWWQLKKSGILTRLPQPKPEAPTDSRPVVAQEARERL